MDFRLVPEVSVTVPNGPALLNSLNALAKEQIPFASAVSLKRMAELSVRRAQGKMGERFTLRNKGVLRGIAFDPRRGPNKRDWPNLKMHVGIDERFSFLVDQELGGRKKARDGGRVAIPTEIVHKRKRTGTGKLKKMVRPGQLPDRYEVSQMLRANTRILPKGLTMFYLLRPEAKIKPRLHLREDVEETVDQTYERVFSQELTAALRSRRSGSTKYSSELGRMRYLRERSKLGTPWR